MKTIVKNFKKFFKYFKKAKKGFIKYSILSFFASVLELMGVALIYPFVFKILDKSAVNSFGVSPYIIGIVIIVIFLLKNIYMIFFIKIQTKYTNEFEILLKEQFMKFLLCDEYQNTYRISLAQKTKVFGLLIPNITNNFIFRLLNLNINLFIFVMITALLAIKFPLATAITVIFACLTIKFQNCVYKPLLNKSSDKVSQAMTCYNQTYNDAVLNLKEIKISNNETAFLNNFKNAMKEYYSEYKKLMFISQIPPYVTEPFIIILLFILLAIITMQNYQSPENLIASFALIASAVFRLAPAIARIQVNLNGINGAVPMVSEFIEIYEKYDIYERVKNVKEKQFADFKESIILKNLSFSYDNNKEVLHNINLEIKKGELIGIAGLSGSGKTTLADIIAGLFKNYSGEILIDREIQVKPLKIGYVPQEFRLIDGSIRDNVVFGSSLIDDSKVIDALKKAQLYDFIVKNYTNRIYENPFIDSTGFSQGQKQRLAIARALYSNPDVLILDEATSSLDLKTEDEICNVINSLKGKKTVIVIAHRLSTIKYTDKIVFMEGGKISHTAPFEELINNSPSFRQFVEISNL